MTKITIKKTLICWVIFTKPAFGFASLAKSLVWAKIPYAYKMVEKIIRFVLHLAL